MRIKKELLNRLLRESPWVEGLNFLAALSALVCMLVIDFDSVITVIAAVLTVSLSIVYFVNFKILHGKSLIHTQILSVLLIVFAIPLIWVNSGGFDGFGPTWMLFCMAFTALNLRKMARAIILIVEAGIFSYTVGISKYHPEWIKQMNPEDMGPALIGSLVIASFYIVLVIAAQNYIVREEKKKTESVIEELRETTEKLHQSLQSQKLFTASMNHELRAPLNGVIGGLQVFTMADNLTSEQQEILRASSMSAKALVQIVNDLLDYSKIEAGEFQIIRDRFNLRDIIEASPTLFFNQMREKGLEFRKDISDDTPLILFGDGPRIQQILNNLLSNAVKYTHKGFVFFGIKIEESNLIITVQDSGEGISDEAIAELYTPFKRINEKEHKKIQGTGLGMYVTKNLVDAMNGTLAVDSKVGEGTTFNVVIPIEVLDDSLTYGNCPADTGRKLTADFSDLSILCVDDSSVNLIIFNKAIAAATHANVDTVDSGKAALEAVKSKTYDIIYMDHRMPEMDGIETFQAIRAMGIETPVVILTGSTDDASIQMFREIGFDAFQSKPTKIDETVANVNRILKRGHQ